MGFTSFLHLAGFLSFPIRLKALDLGRSNRTGNFRPKYAPLKNFCWRIHRNPLFWDIGLSTTFFFRIFFAVKLWPEKTKGETKTADFLVLKDSTLSSSPGPDFAPLWQRLCMEKARDSRCMRWYVGRRRRRRHGWHWWDKSFLLQHLEGRFPNWDVGTSPNVQLLMEPHVSPVGMGPTHGLFPSKLWILGVVSNLEPASNHCKVRSSRWIRWHVKNSSWFHRTIPKPVKKSYPK